VGRTSVVTSVSQPWRLRRTTTPMNLDDLSLWRSFGIETSWSPTAAARELSRWIRKPRYFRLLWDTATMTSFVGKAIDDHTFRFTTRDPGSKVARPSITVTVEPLERGGSVVRVRMQPPVSSMIAVPLVLLLSLCTFFVPHTYHRGRAPVPGAIALYALVVTFGYWAMLLAEMRRAERWLLEIYASAPAG
jgi:hypothetical protein